MRRSIRVKLDFVVELDDDGYGLPSVGDPGDALAKVAEIVVPGAALLMPGGRISVGLTRESSIAIRQVRKAASRGSAP